MEVKADEAISERKVEEPRESERDRESKQALFSLSSRTIEVAGNGSSKKPGVRRNPHTLKIDFDSNPLDVSRAEQSKRSNNGIDADAPFVFQNE